MTDDIEIPRTLAEATPLLKPRPLGLVPFQIRGQQLALQGAESAVDTAIPVAADYYLGAILDLPAADVPVTGGMLDSWGVDMAAVFAAARENTAQDEAGVQSFDAALVISGMPFAAAVLRDPAALAAFATEATAVIIIPEPGTVLLGFAEDDDSLNSLARAAEASLAGASRTVSAMPLIRSGDGWAPFEWPAEVAAPVGRLQRRWDSVQYAASRPVLQETYRAAGDEAFVAELVLAEGEGGAYATYATLMDMRTVVPRADMLVLSADDGRISHVPFAEVAAMAGVLSPAPGTVPEYFVVDRFPVELI